jgi:hypothetical protein
MNLLKTSWFKEEITIRNKKYFELNNVKDITKLWIQPKQCWEGKSVLNWTWFTRHDNQCSKHPSQKVKHKQQNSKLNSKKGK